MPKSKKNNKRGDLYVRFMVDFDNENLEEILEILSKNKEHKNEDTSNKQKIVNCCILPIIERNLI